MDGKEDVEAGSSLLEPTLTCLRATALDVRGMETSRKVHEQAMHDPVCMVNVNRPHIGIGPSLRLNLSSHLLEKRYKGKLNNLMTSCAANDSGLCLLNSWSDLDHEPCTSTA